MSDKLLEKAVTPAGETTSTALPSLPASAPRVNHYAFLDGLRGIGAILIVLGHAFAIYAAQLSTGGQKLMLPVELIGGYALIAFFVLSGWCLMIPVAKTETLTLRDGFWGYVYRRAKRIIPPYYAALLIACVLPAFVTLLRTGTWPIKWFQPWAMYLGKRDLLSHLALVQTLSPQYSENISPPFWSVACEWQIYFLFALTLLPILRRFGMIAVLIAAAVIGIVPLYLMDWSRSLAVHSWMVLPFAMGMVGSLLTYSKDPRINTQTKTLAIFGILLTAGILLFSHAVPTSGNPDIWGGPILAGLLVTGSLVWLSRQTGRLSPWSPKRILESRPAVWLGKFSYSIYLMHYTIMLAMLPFVARYHWSAKRLILLNLIVGVPLAIAGSRLFYYCFERPFLKEPGAEPKVRFAAGSASHS